MNVKTDAEMLHDELKHADAIIVETDWMAHPSKTRY